MNASPQIVKLLIQKGADINAEDAKSLSFVQLAKLNGNQDILQIVEPCKVKSTVKGNSSDREE